MATSSSFTSQFPEALFRDAILNTMLMGVPDDEAQRLTWVWDRQLTYSPDDPAGNPYDWGSSPVTDTAANTDLPDPGAGEPQTLVVPYVLEFSPRAGQASTVLGEIDTSQATVTLMDSDYERVKTADHAVIGDTTYRIQFDAPPQGLFGVTVWSVFLEATDES